VQAITGHLPADLEEQLGGSNPAKAAPIHVATFRQLMEHTARIAYRNKDYLLFFRGQTSDYQNKAGASSFYPTIYRGERLSKPELEQRFDHLRGACSRMIDILRRENIEGAADVQRRRLIQWSILQHYEVCATPLLDFTQSIRVACSFALATAGKQEPFVYVFGLPYITNRISINSEQDLVNVRLLSICPPDALRPYFQEGFLAGTDDVTSDYISKDELDFNNRLIAKFSIGRGARFWGRSFSPIPKTALYPSGDRLLSLCERIRVEVEDGVRPADLGAFLQAWTALESRLMSLSRELEDRTYTVRDAIRVLQRSAQLSPAFLKRLDDLRQLRNRAVHGPDRMRPEQLRRGAEEGAQLLRLLASGTVVENTP
jgi:hypothetical protein